MDPTSALRTKKCTRCQSQKTMEHFTVPISGAERGTCNDCRAVLVIYHTGKLFANNTRNPMQQMQGNVHTITLSQIQLLSVVGVPYKTYQPILLTCERIPTPTIGLQMKEKKILFDVEQTLLRQQNIAVGPVRFGVVIFRHLRHHHLYNQHLHHHNLMRLYP